MIIAIHTVFILKENILFLEEWINYHILLGFNKFYLYDNSKVQKSGGCHPNHKCFKVGKVNKYNINYENIVNMTNEQMYDYIEKICNKYKCIEFIEWSPKDRNGIILHYQKEAHNNCLNIMKKNNIDWCANIDMDEYIVVKDYDNILEYILTLPSNIKNIKFGQIKFDSRFNNLDKSVIDIYNSDIEYSDRDSGNKNIYCVNNTNELSVHSVSLENNYIEVMPSVDEICINHYKLNNKNYKIVDNIHNKIKIKFNRDSFIKLNIEIL